MSSIAHYLYLNVQKRDFLFDGCIFTTYPCPCCNLPDRHFDLVKLKTVSEMYPNGRIPTKIEFCEADIKVKIICGTEIIGFFTVRIKEAGKMRARKDVSKYIKDKKPARHRLIFMTMEGIEDKIIKKVPHVTDMIIL